MRIDGFDWDDGNRAKCQRHGVPLEEIEALFESAPGVYADPGHSIDEQRLRAIGRTTHGRWVIVAFTLRQRSAATLVRPISARYMHAKEVRRYEQGRTQAAAGAAQRR